ncbi:hypothetical protein BDN71DRAFT_1436798 [Pleurotus eryngii]|uniref:Uncharacterized protein n=1 Tax=Pleurotus eryngii TaxID=5323 RepID=A0A9P5ZFY0_PLEER|nr:hypothetical protein BDN71DRAFT_1436798 [Pleurotus eryngii]
MPNKASPSPAGSSPVNIPSNSHLPDMDLLYSPTSSKPPHHPSRLPSVMPSLSSLMNVPLDSQGTPSECPEFQASLLAVLAQWKVPHVEGVWLSSLQEELLTFCDPTVGPDVVTLLYQGETLSSFPHLYLLLLGHISLALHQILTELAVLKDDPHGFIFDPDFKALRSMEGVADPYLFKATWGVILFRAKCACEHIENELWRYHISLGQTDGLSLHSNDSTLSEVQDDFLLNSPRTNVFQLLQQDDYHQGITSVTQAPVESWLCSLPATRPPVPTHQYRSELNSLTSTPLLLPLVTTPHPVQVHFTSTTPATSVYIPGFGRIDDTQGTAFPCTPPTFRDPAGSCTGIVINMVIALRRLVLQIIERTMITEINHLHTPKGNSLHIPGTIPIIPMMTIMDQEEDLEAEEVEEMEVGQVATVEETAALDLVLEATLAMVVPLHREGLTILPLPLDPDILEEITITQIPLHLDSKIPLSSLPEWDGSPTSVIHYQLGEGVTGNLAQAAPFKFTGLAKAWFNGLPVTACITCTANMMNFLIFICNQFMHEEWHYDRSLEFDKMYFHRGKEFRNELPIEWILHCLSYAQLLYLEEAQQELLNNLVFCMPGNKNARKL